MAFVSDASRVPQPLEEDGVLVLILCALPTRDLPSFAKACSAWANAVRDSPGDIAFDARLIPYFGNATTVARVTAMLSFEEPFEYESGTRAANMARTLVQWVVEAQRLAPPLERLQTFVPRPVAAARLEGADVFAQTKRVLVSTQMSFSAAKSDRVCVWMQCVYEAMEQKDMSCALPLWESYGLHNASSCHHVMEDAVRWLVQLAFWLDELPKLFHVLKCSDVGRVALSRYAADLALEPGLGVFPEVDRTLQASHLQRFLRRLGCA